MATTAVNLPDIASLLDAHSLRKVAIIDDAFNELPSYGDVNDEIAELLTAGLLADEALSQRLAATGIVLLAPEHLTQDIWDSLWRAAESDAVLKGQLNALGTSRNQTLHVLTELGNYFQNTLRRDVELVAANKQLQDASAQILFIDYYLEGDNKETSLLLAEKLGRRIAELYVDGVSRPLVVLMSSRQELTDLDKATFREAAEFVGGMFHYIPKEDLKDIGLLDIFLYLVTSTYPQGEAIADFVDSVQKAASEALDQLRLRLQGLSVDDFGYIHQLTLSQEGIPLSDYVTSLLASLFNQEFRSRTLTDDQKVDTMSFDQLSFQEKAPSVEFSRLFLGVVSQPVNELKRHPQATIEDYPEGEATPVDLHFGDLFVNGNSVLIVATAECDLICTPGNPKARRFDPLQKVLLIPGTLKPYEIPWQKFKSRTEFVSVGEQFAAVEWDFKKSETQDLGSVANHLSHAGFHRKRRLNPEFALDVQRMYFNDVGRIGLPVGPPIYRSLGAKLCAAGPNGEVITLLDEVNGPNNLCVSFLTRSDLWYQLTGDFLLRLPSAIKSAIEHLEGAKATSQGKAKGKFTAAITKLKAISFDQIKLAELRKPFLPIKAGAEAPFVPLKDCLMISYKPLGEQYTCDRPLLLSLGTAVLTPELLPQGDYTAIEVGPEATPLQEEAENATPTNPEI